MTAANRLFRAGLAVALCAALPACNVTQRLADLGEAPKLSPIENPQAQKGYQPIALPMPTPEPSVKLANSLWRPGARAFFKDQRAARVGDIVTVVVNIADKATANNASNRSRSTTETAGLENLLGTEVNSANGGTSGSMIENIFRGATPGALVNGTSTSSYAGAGKIQRDETVTSQIAAIVTQVLPNGNLVVQGRQEVRVNYEVRELLISGVVRPEDITATNQVEHTKIAEARISYGGRGQIMDVQQPRYGTQLFDIIFPF